MDKSEQIIQDLINSIESRQNTFLDQLPSMQKYLHKQILSISKEFYIPAKTVKQQAYNLKLISKIKNEVDGVLKTTDYTKSVKEFMKGFGDVERIQNLYFSTVFTEFSAIPLLKEIKNTAIDVTLDKLSIDGLGGAISGKVRDILYQNINKGGSYSSMVNDLESFILDSKDTEGALTRYSKQIVTDSLNQYSANYTKAVTDDLGLDWYIYVGSLRKTSRPFCLRLIAAKQTCMPYIHKSQLQEISEGHICNEKVSLAGLIDGTDGSNLQVNRGGYNCNHQLIPVSEAVVPKDLIDKFS